MKTWSIYILVCPLTKDIKYVGITSTSLEKRLAYHLKGNDHNPQKSRWIAWLSAQGLVPEIHFIAQCIGTRQQAEQKERLCIWNYIAQGYSLFNQVYIPGGDYAFFAAYLRRTALDNE
jgi:GIY-YIG catalytic domain